MSKVVVVIVEDPSLTSSQALVKLLSIGAEAKFTLASVGGIINREESFTSSSLMLENGLRDRVLSDCWERDEIGAEPGSQLTEVVD